MKHLITIAILILLTLIFVYLPYGVGEHLMTSEEKAKNSKLNIWCFGLVIMFIVSVVTAAIIVIYQIIYSAL